MHELNYIYFVNMYFSFYNFRKKNIFKRRHENDNDSLTEEKSLTIFQEDELTKILVSKIAQ